MVFDTSNINEVISVNRFVDVFVFGDFSIHHKNWLTYSGGTGRPGELCYNFSISKDLTLMVNFPTRIPECDFCSPAPLEFDPSFYFAVAFTPLYCISFHWLFSNWK